MAQRRCNGWSPQRIQAEAVPQSGDRRSYQSEVAGLLANANF
jgi:hypothetical protein